MLRDAIAHGPVYIHCPQRRRRRDRRQPRLDAPAEAAVQRMHIAGTSPQYEGLYACAARSAVIEPARIDAVPAEFPEVQRPQGFVKGT